MVVRHKGSHKFDKIFQTVEVKTADYAITAEDTGKLLVGNKSGSAMTFTLPAVATAKGCTWDFIQMKDENLVIAGPSDSIVAKHNVAADSVTFSTSTEKIGAGCRVICDGVRHYFQNTSGCTDGDGSG